MRMLERQPPSCSRRIGLAVRITPNVADVEPAAGTTAPGCPRLTMLKAFVASARNVILTRFCKRKSRERARSNHFCGAQRSISSTMRNHPQPATESKGWKNALSPYGRMVTQTFASWNQIGQWLSQIDALRRAAA